MNIDGYNFFPEFISGANSFTTSSNVTTTIPKYPMLVGVYPAGGGLLANGAKKDVITGYVGWLGGPADGSTTIEVNVNMGIYPEGVYQFAVKYIAGDSRSFKVDVNGANTGILYTPPITNSWISKDAKTFTIPLRLKPGVNKIKFHGDGKVYSPDLGDITVNIVENTFPIIDPTVPNPITSPPNISTLPVTNTIPVPIIPPNTSTMPIKPVYPIVVGTYPAIKGVLVKPAIQDPLTGFLGWIGGPADGSTTIEVNVNTGTYPFGVYEFLIKYISAEPRSFKVDVNGVNTGILYNPEKTNSWFLKDAKTFTLPLALKTGLNRIKLHGDGKNYGPNFGDITVNIIANTFFIMNPTVPNPIISPPNISTLPVTSTIPVPVIPPMIPVPTIPLTIPVGPIQKPLNTNSNLVLSTYNIALGALNKGATVDSVTNFVANIGGINDGASILNVTVDATGLYTLVITYLSGDGTRTLKLDVNNNNLQTIYTLPMTKSWNISDAQVYKLNVVLNSGVNTIKFHGDGINSSPYLGMFNIERSISLVSSSIMLMGSASLNGNFIEGIGGTGDGQVVLNVDILYDGVYDFAIHYLASDNNKKIKIDVNGINSGVVYNFDMTESMSVANERVKIIRLALTKGENIIRIYS